MPGDPDRLEGSLSSKSYPVSKAFEATIKNKTKQDQKITSYGEDVEKRKPSYTASGNMKSSATVESSLAVPQKVKHRITM